MAKLVKLTDEIGSLLEERAKNDGTTLAGEIKLLLDGKDDSNINQRLDKMARWLDEKFTDLEAALDGAVLSQSPARSSVTLYRKKEPTELEWPLVQDLMFDILPDGDSAWLPGKERAARDSDNLSYDPFFTDGEVIYSEGMFGRVDWLKVTPDILTYLKQFKEDL